MKMKDFLRVYNDACLEIVGQNNETLYKEIPGMFQDWKTEEQLIEEFGDLQIYSLCAYTDPTDLCTIFVVYTEKS